VKLPMQVSIGKSSIFIITFFKESYGFFLFGIVLEGPQRIRQLSPVYAMV
jgi:hypothetical protein